jgi:hypothetical protein
MVKEFMLNDNGILCTNITGICVVGGATHANPSFPIYDYRRLLEAPHNIQSDTLELLFDQ